MDGSNNGFYALVIAPLVTAVGWLAKRLYDAPRQSELDAIRKNRDELQVIINDGLREARELARSTDIENRRLRDKIIRLEAQILQETTGGRDDARPTRPRIERAQRRVRSKTADQ